MGITDLKEKMRIKNPLDLLKKIKEALLALLSGVPALLKGLFNLSPGTSDEDGQSRLPPQSRKIRLIVLGVAGVTVVLIVSIIIVVVINTTRLEGGEIPNVTTAISIPPEDFFFPSEPDFLPGFLPEREPRRFWSLEDIRQYWKVPENSDWWRGEIKSTVDKLMEGVP